MHRFALAVWIFVCVHNLALVKAGVPYAITPEKSLNGAIVEIGENSHDQSGKLLGFGPDETPLGTDAPEAEAIKAEQAANPNPVMDITEQLHQTVGQITGASAVAGK